MDSRVQSVDFHDAGIEIWHSRIELGEIFSVYGVDLGHELRAAFGVFVKLYQRPHNVQPDTVVATW